MSTPEKQRLDLAAMEWMQIPEQARCVCGHEKAVHSLGAARLCEPDGSRNRRRECTCVGFLDRDSKIGWVVFADRLVKPSESRSREVGALRTAFARCGWHLAEADSMPFDNWREKARRAWKAWQDAGRPMSVAGREVFHGPVSIPELES